MTLEPSKTFIREIERNDGSTLHIHQLEEGDVGSVVWDAALVLVKYLEKQTRSDSLNGDKTSLLAGKNILELGSGTGVVGIEAACHQDTCVTITDLATFVPLMQCNIKRNCHLFRGQIRARELQWGCDVSQFDPVDVLLLADCVYYRASIDQLLQTVCELADENTVVYCAYEDREIGNKTELQEYFRAGMEKVFNMTKLPSSEMDPVFRSDDIHILKFCKQK
ncbi:PREDICTED: protein-lysine methyltransferase METTL21D-like [Priapulus caudatus]|uniref:Protein-lysine methyltransferase METTL21D-like n=1 Tax=Priapulus caudatus TaxID=37621 RepID=A0ABM1EGK3_PRICU|nr:PREDICTED: protein-lysine methyltransferase METTL21D-like [Priapulus caudatus]XP_014671324.1 PREDICTED: protein-lysine methyltransferase METTL21D-like [Priapulus caudatus]